MSPDSIIDQPATVPDENPLAHLKEYSQYIGVPSGLPWSVITKLVHEKKATDLIITPQGVKLRVDRDIQPLPDQLSGHSPDNHIQALISTLPSHYHLTQLYSEIGGTDFAVVLPVDGRPTGQRYRGNLFFSNAGLCGAYRPLPTEVIPARAQMFSSQVLSYFTKLKEGLVIVAGPTGSGKSTTLVSLIDEINKNYPYHIITIEDPIEFVFTPKKATFSQREIGTHTDSFETGLRSALRQNPDIIFVGEIRDYITAQCALQAAETGHLVLATLHTRRAHTTINRLISIAPEAEKDNFRTNLAQNLAMIICQRLLKRKEGGIIPCREILLGSHSGIQAAITNGKEREEIPNILTTNRAIGMVDWNNALLQLEKDNQITREEADKYREK